MRDNSTGLQMSQTLSPTCGITCKDFLENEFPGFPTFFFLGLNRKCIIFRGMDQTLFAVVREASLQGISTVKVDDLVRSPDGQEPSPGRALECQPPTG